jgi:hypothetical protein
MGYKGKKEADKQLSFSRLLESLNIPYKEIDYKHPLAIEYPGIQKEIQTIPKNNIERKRWICMEPRAFKNTILMLNTENAGLVRQYYLNLEEAMFAYGEYTMNFLVDRRDLELSQAMEQLAIKDTELEQEKEARVKAERKAIRINKFMKRITIKENKAEWIYIATTKFYSRERIFKPGSTIRLSSRIGPYNTGRPVEDAYYYCWAMRCYNSKDVDYHIQKLLADFKHKDNAELVVGIKFSDLKDILTFIVNNYDASVDYINNFIRTRMDASLEEEDEPPPRLDYKRFTVQIGEHTETIDLEEEESDSVREAFEDILLSLKEQEDSEMLVLQRKDLMTRLSNKTNAPKKDLWYQIKELTGWTNSKTEIDDGGFRYKIIY